MDLEQVRQRLLREALEKMRLVEEKLHKAEMVVLELRCEWEALGVTANFLTKVRREENVKVVPIAEKG
jgi:hypothetical protein